MLFDKLCGIVERCFLPVRKGMPISWRRLLQEAKILEFPLNSESPPANYDPEFVTDHFFLPFRTIVAEDKLGLTLLHDFEADMRGTAVDRFFLNFWSSSIRASHYVTPEEINSFEKRWLDEYGNDYRGCFVLQTGVIKRLLVRSEKPSFSLYGVLTKHFVCTEKEVVYGKIYDDVADQDEIYRRRAREASNDVDVTFEQIIRLNSPDRFVVEASPLKQKDRRKQSKITRCHERPKFKLLTVTEIKKNFGLSGSSTGATGLGSPKSGHPRRRHYRTLKSERFSEEKRREPIIIPATWVGPSEVVIGNKRYKVRLDV